MVLHKDGVMAKMLLNFDKLESVYFVKNSEYKNINIILIFYMMFLIFISQSEEFDILCFNIRNTRFS
jgi:hypothetical protein